MLGLGTRKISAKPVPLREVDAVGVFESILQLPFAFLWLPGLAFVIVAGPIYWLSKSASYAVRAPAIEVKSDTAAPVPKATPKDRRSMHRRQGNPVEVHVAPPGDKKSPGVGSVLDRAVGGMRLALVDEVAVGTVLAVHPVHADAMVPWVELEVRSCVPSTEMPDKFEIGCRYVKSPPYSIQLLFG